MATEHANGREALMATVQRGGLAHESAEAHGAFDIKCYGPDGALKWEDTAPNLVTTVGKNLALDTYLAGSAYTVVGPFLGLISSVNFTTGPVLGDTMGVHGGWTEAGTTNAPQYTAPRQTTNAGWSAAAGGIKAVTSPKTFAITSSGTIKGAFLVFGAGAVNTILDPNGTLYSAGTFTDKIVSNGDTLSVTYSTQL